jgi:quercetin dioxygenase-like cupin family protein
MSGCGDDDSASTDDSDRGAGIAGLGAGARVETLARARLPARPSGDLAWIASELRLAPGESVAHEHEAAFVYVRRGSSSGLDEGEGAWLPGGRRHVHRAQDGAATIWEIRLARPGSPPPEGERPVFESDPLEGFPQPAALSFLEVEVPPRGGRTTVHTHPGPELIYQLSGRIDYENALIGERRLGPGGLEGIPPETAVQKRNPFANPAVFLSWFAVDPDRPFAPRASF